MTNTFEEQWLVDLPCTWVEKRADFLCDSHRTTVDPSQFGDNLVAHYSIPQVQETGGPIIEPASDIDSSKLLITTDTLLVSKLNPRKRTICIATPHGDHPTVASGEFVAIKSDKIDQRYAYYLWCSEKVTDRLSAIVQSVTRSHQRVNPSDIQKLPWKWPPLETQRRIAQFLDEKTVRIDALIEKKRALLDRLAEKRQAMITRAVTKGLNPDAPMKPSGIDWLGDIPAHWEVKRLISFCDFQSGKAHEPFIDQDGAYICVNARFVSTDGVAEKRCTVNLTPAIPGDILMVMSDLPNGRALARSFLVNDQRQYAVNQRVCRIRTQRGLPAYFSYQLNRNPQLLRYNDGKEQTHLSNSTFKLVQLLQPPEDEQWRIVDYLDEVVFILGKTAAQIEASVELLTEYRSALITAAVTGQLEIA